MKTPITVEALRHLIADWPNHGPDGQPTQILLAPSHPDCPLGLEPVVLAGTTEDGTGLCLYPEQREIPAGSLAANASALDVAAAALRYQLTTPCLEYDPEVANQLFHRAVVAIEQAQGLERGIAQ